jgi:hypothetical protein
MSNGQQPDNPLFALCTWRRACGSRAPCGRRRTSKVADAIGDEPVPSRARGADGHRPANLKRLMNALVAAGVFAAAGDDAFGHGRFRRS